MRIEPAPSFSFPDPPPAVPDPALETPLPQSQAYAIQWQPDLPPLPAYPPAVHAARGTDYSNLRINEWHEASHLRESDEADLEIVEPAQPIYANLIQFPRELVAARRVRPRLAEGPFVISEPGSQLSIFEVDPVTVSTEPAVADAVQQAPSWTAPNWSDIELDTQPSYDLDELPEVAAVEPAAVPAIALAPLNRRLLAALVDGALIVGASLLVATLALSHSKVLPGIRDLELGGVFGFAIAATLYQMLFLTLATATPGMRYAHIRLITFDGQIPSRAQRIRRLAALPLSILPVGLGLAWAIFDEDHMSWHDRLSRTYPQKSFGAGFIG